MFKHNIFSIRLGNLNKQSQGFTLMEVSLVLAIVSTVVALAVAALGGAKGDTQDKKRKSNLVAIESAKTRYMLNNDPSILNQPTDLEEIAPYLSIGGSPVASLFDLLKGTGKSTDDLSLGTYGGVPASYDGEAMVAAGLVNVDGEWMDPESARIAYANQAEGILVAGGSWEDLSPEQKEGYANTYPSQAVAIGGADALNALDPSNLSPELVTGYVNNGGIWVAPYQSFAVIGNTSFPYTSTNWYGWNQQFPIAVVTNPLFPSVIVGYIVPQYYPLMWVGTNPPPDSISSKHYTAVITPNPFNISVANTNMAIVNGPSVDPTNPSSPNSFYNWNQVFTLGNPSAANVDITTPQGYPVTILDTVGSQ